MYHHPRCSCFVVSTNLGDNVSAAGMLLTFDIFPLFMVKILRQGGCLHIEVLITSPPLYSSTALKILGG